MVAKAQCVSAETGRHCFYGAQQTSSIVEELKAQRVYPYKDEPVSALERLEREAFDVAAASSLNAFPNLHNAGPDVLAFVVRLIRNVVETNPTQLSRMLKETLQASDEVQDTLDEKLHYASLKGRIAPGCQIADRVKFIEAMECVVLGDELQQHSKNRTSLFKHLEQNTWVFGEQYNLWANDCSLAKALQPFAAKHNLVVDHEARNANAGQGQSMIDYMLFHSLRGYGDDKPEYLVTVIVAPDHSLNYNDLHKIENFAGDVFSNGPYHSVDDLRWHFWIITDQYDDHVEFRITIGPDCRNSLIGRSEREAIGLKTWAEIIRENKSRLDYIGAAFDDGVPIGQSLEHPREQQYRANNRVVSTQDMDVSDLIESRFNLVSNLSSVLSDISIQKQGGERALLRKTLEQNAWVFGEQYNLWIYDNSLASILDKNIKHGDLQIDAVKPVTDSGEVQGDNSLLLPFSQRGYNIHEIEYLIVHIEPSGHTIERSDLHRVEDIAAAMEAEEHFRDVEGVYWHFWLVGDEYSEAVQRRIEMGPGRRSRLIEKGEQTIVGVKTWTEIMTSCKVRLEHVSRAIGFNASEEH